MHFYFTIAETHSFQQPSRTEENTMTTKTTATKKTTKTTKTVKAPVAETKPTSEERRRLIASRATKIDVPPPVTSTRAATLAANAQVGKTNGAKPATVVVAPKASADGKTHVLRDVLAPRVAGVGVGVVPQTKAGAAAHAKAEADKEVKAEVKKERKLREGTVSGCFQKAILDGLTDEQATDAVCKAFPDFDREEKATYASWYRAYLVRKGTITKQFADEHRHAKTAS